MATVVLQPVAATVEGDVASVGVELTPPGMGTAISITVTLGPIDGDASKYMRAVVQVVDRFYFFTFLRGSGERERERDRQTEIEVG